MRIYLEDEKKEFVEVKFSSILKANFLSSLVIGAMFYGVALLLGLLLEPLA